MHTPPTPPRRSSSRPLAVEARGIHKAYPSGDGVLHALSAVDLEIGRGEFVSIMGPSGSGKSTLLNLIGLLDVPTSGHLALLGQSTTGLRPAAQALARRRHLGFVFQSFNLMPRLSALQNVLLPMALAGVPRSSRRGRAQRLLAEVGLEDRMGHKPAQLSGGQKQRVAIARALALDPPILLADEPTGNLDSNTSVDVMELFRRLNGAGKTIIQVTHSEEMAAFGKRVIRFRDGRIIAREAARPGKARAVAPPAGRVAHDPPASKWGGSETFVLFEESDQAGTPPGAGGR